MQAQKADLGDLDKHFWLTRSVARVMGINLLEAMSEGRMSSDDYAAMVTQCRAGKCHHVCQIWLACQTDTAAEAPHGCPHRDLLLRLRQQ